MSKRGGSSSPIHLGTATTFPCGVVLPNKIIKPAMTECMADPSTNLPNESLTALYAAWAQGSAGGLTTGNVQVDRRYLEAPGNVCMELIDMAPERLTLYKQWAQACKSNGNIAIVQLSHPGRQCPLSVAWTPITATGGQKTKLSGIPRWAAPAGVPRTATLTEISDVVDRFVHAARVSKAAGFDGVQIHSAHGYLLSQFLSPLVNKRNDQYGGSAENRRRLLLEVVDRVRAEVGKNYLVAVKLNSDDFAKGGFSESESLAVIRELHAHGIDYIEISGGTYENMIAMKAVDAAARQSTKLREAFFIDFCDKVRQQTPDVLIMLSGGWRDGGAMHAAVSDGRVDLIGIARPLCVEPDLARRLVDYSSRRSSGSVVDGDAPRAIDYNLHVNMPILGAGLNSTLDTLLENFWHQGQMRLIASGKKPSLDLGGWWYMFTVQAVRSYVWEPRRNPTKTRIIIGLLVAAAGAIATACYNKRN